MYCLLDKPHSIWDCFVHWVVAYMNFWCFVFIHSVLWMMLWKRDHLKLAHTLDSESRLNTKTCVWIWMTSTDCINFFNLDCFFLLWSNSDLASLPLLFARAFNGGINCKHLWVIWGFILLVLNYNVIFPFLCITNSSRSFPSPPFIFCSKKHVRNLKFQSVSTIHKSQGTIVRKISKKTFLNMTFVCTTWDKGGLIQKFDLNSAPKGTDKIVTLMRAS